MSSHSVTFEPSGRTVLAETGEDLLTVARRAGVELESSCGGKGSCGKCRVRIEDGATVPDRAPSADQVSTPTDTERRLLGSDLLATGLRLACQTKVQGDLRVFVPVESRRSKAVAVKYARERDRHVDPAVRSYPFTLPAGDTSLTERVLNALADLHGLAGLEMTKVAADAIQELGESPGRTLAAVVWQEAVVLDIRDATESVPILGLALDAGTTTVAGYLADLSTGEVLSSESTLNPQISYGDDIIARLQYAAHNTDGARELQERLAAAVDRLAEQAAEQCGASSGDIYDVVMVGNTAMHHLFMGVPTDSLRRAPFEPSVKVAIDTTAAEVGLHLHPSCRLYALPNEAGFVGADNTAVIIAEEPYRKDEASLLIDVGTNGELVLGDRRRMLSASCATGPAFEGAHIEHGMRAAPGAIERIRIDPETLEVDFKVIGHDAWSRDLPAGQVKARGICGSGVIEAAAEMFKCGIILPDGGFTPDLVHERILLEDGRPRRLVIARPEETETGRPITVSLKDIRALQLGKAALRAGAEILLSEFGIAKPDRVVLAGAFGSYIDKGAALTIGMLPPCEPDKVVSVGNAAGDGALLALLSLDKRREAEWVADAVEYVELASATDFQRRYMEAMRFEPSIPGLV